MFSQADPWQEMVAVAVALGAVAYLVMRVVGWPKRRSDGPNTNVVPSPRLAKALRKAHQHRA